MKLKISLILCFFAFLSCETLKNKSNCAGLEVKKMTLVDNQKIDVEVYFASRNTAHINYPYISSVLNSRGDTLAKGDMIFYAMLPNTSEVFNLAVQPNQILSKGKYKIVFIKEGVETCMLRYTF